MKVELDEYNVASIEQRTADKIVKQLYKNNIQKQIANIVANEVYHKFCDDCLELLGDKIDEVIDKAINTVSNRANIMFTDKAKENDEE